MNSVRSNNQILKYQKFTLSGYKNIGINKFEFEAKNQSHWKKHLKSEF